MWGNAIKLIIAGGAAAGLYRSGDEVGEGVKSALIVAGIGAALYLATRKG